jgi:hypothetical protein
MRSAGGRDEGERRLGCSLGSSAGLGAYDRLSQHIQISPRRASPRQFIISCILPSLRVPVACFGMGFGAGLTFSEYHGPVHPLPNV